MFAKSKLILVLILAHLLISTFAFSQTHFLDSLKFSLKNATHDTTRLRIRDNIGEAESIFRIGYWDSILRDAKKLKIRDIESDALNNIGFIYYTNGNYIKASEFYSKSLELSTQFNDKAGIATALCNLGLVYDDQANIPKALNYYEKSLKLFEEISDQHGIAYVLNNIGLIYFNQGELNSALKYYNKSLEIQKKIGKIDGIITSLNNIGILYNEQGNSKKALENYKECLKLERQINDEYGIALSLNNIGAIFFGENNMDSALYYQTKSLKMRTQLIDNKGKAFSYYSVGTIYLKQKNYALAKSYLDSSLIISKKIGLPEQIMATEEELSNVDFATGNFDGAFYHYKQYVLYKDSISNESNRKASINNQLKYEFEKKEAIIIEQQEKERAVTEEKNRFQQIIIWSVAIGFLLVLVFATFVFRALKTTRLQKIIIEEKQREILGSIRYAKRIQKSLLPTETYIDRNLKRLNK